MTRHLPRGLYGPDRDGLGDPERPSTVQRLTWSPERIAEEADRAAAPSPMLRRLRAVALRFPTPTTTTRGTTMTTNSPDLDTLEVLARGGRPLTEYDRGALLAVERSRPNLAGRVAGVRRLDAENTARADRRRKAKADADAEAQRDARLAARVREGLA